jgi:aryl-alcohol dehydrogenase-like predicted oxidoreductase
MTRVPELLQKFFPAINKPVSQVSFGMLPCRMAERDKWFTMMDHFLAAGGTLFDTSRIYGDGESEAVLGTWVCERQVREQVAITTKCGHGGALGILPDQGFEAMVTEEVAKSLATLDTDYIDLLLLHRDNPVVPVGRIVDRLNQELVRGTILAFGASNWSYERVEEANSYAKQHGIHGFSVVSNHLSLADPREPFYPRLVAVDAAGELWHERTQIPLLSWSAQARGFFTGSYQPGLVSESDTFSKRMLEVYATPLNLERLHRAEDLGRRHGGYSATQIALAWLLHKPYPLIPVIGPRTSAELDDCLAAILLKLTNEECAWLVGLSG